MNLITIPMDFPDPDVIRVEKTYYMISTTMHFFPGGTILKSFDLKNWEFCTNLFDKLAETDNQKLKNGRHAYGQGMWAASLCYINQLFYVSFSANDTQETYIFRSEDIENGNWSKNTIKGIFHDSSLYFEKGHFYLIHGNTDIYLTELTEDASDLKKGGIHNLLISDTSDTNLGYEGSHFYKIGSFYYLFVIHWPKSGFGRRVQSCFRSSTLTGQYEGQIVFDEDNGYWNQGIAQGGIVDTPEGNWYAMLFQDLGAVGRAPVLLPVEFKNSFPVFGNDGKSPLEHFGPDEKKEYTYKPLVGSDSFISNESSVDKYTLSNYWQWNHEPNNENWWIDEKLKGLCIQTNSVAANIIQSQNTLTQRATYPKTEVSVTIDGSKLNNGDYSGIAAFQGCYAFIGLTKENKSYYLVLQQRFAKDETPFGNLDFNEQPTITEKILLEAEKVEVKLELNFENKNDYAIFYYKISEKWKKIGGRHSLFFKMDHFTGCRIGLCTYSTEQVGGIGCYSNFIYKC